MRASERRPEGQRCSGSRDGEGEATGATRGARGKSCFKTGQNSRHPPCFCALLVSDPIRCLHIVQNWAPPSWKASGRPVWVLRLVLPRSNLTCDLVFVLLQKEKSKKKKTGQAKVATRRQSAAAAAAASIAMDKLGEFERRVDIVASLLALNHEARSLDDSVPKLLPRTAALYGGLGGMEKDGMAYTKAMDKVDYANKKLLKGLESVCWKPDGAAAAADSAWPAAQSLEPRGQSPAPTPAPARMLAKMTSSAEPRRRRKATSLCDVTRRTEIRCSRNAP